jgi:SEC-C motif-containing protein
LLDGAHAASAEALMRSRYCACASQNIDYLLATAHPRQRKQYNPAELQQWLENKKWIKLEIVAVRKGSGKDKMGRVQFQALYEEKGQQFWHRELSRFEKLKGQWYFLDGQTPQT